MFSAAIPIH